MMSELDIAKKQAVEVAADLQYPDEVCKRIRNAESEIEITRILAMARRAA